jgi:branched-chain amino acid transport system permease protein
MKQKETAAKTPRKTITPRRIPTWLSYAINFVLFALFLFVLQSLVTNKVINTSSSKILMLIGVNIILAVSLNIATGYLGQLPLGHAGFMAVGAYTSAILLKTFDLPFFVTLLLGGLMAAIFGLIIGIPALRLKGDYLAIITLGFGEIIRVVLLNIDDLLGFKLTYGAASLKNIPKDTTVFNTFLTVGIVIFLIHTMMKSRHGRAILAIRENEIAAEACGIRTTFYKTLGFVSSAFFAGVAGGLYASYLGILSPGGFGFMKSIEILVMVVLGGMGSMLGSVVSATVLTALPEALRAFSDYRMVVYSVLLIAVMIFKPSGLFGMYDFSLRRVIEKFLGLVAPVKENKEGEKE